MRKAIVNFDKQVATQSVNFEIVLAGETVPITGTSCSGPTFASIIALINAELALAGKPALGFLNPFLYQKGFATFTDITTGKNAGSTCPDNSVNLLLYGRIGVLTSFAPVFRLRLRQLEDGIHSQVCLSD
jgi:subtilase family serine protease